MKGSQVGKHSGKKNSHFGTCWLFKNDESISVKNEMVDEYLQNGWQRGRKIKNKENIIKANQNKTWIHKDSQKKMIYKDQIDQYINDGWKFGTKDKNILDDSTKTLILLKNVHCSDCGNIIVKPLHSRLIGCYCDSCKEKRYLKLQKSSLKKCRICGNINCKNEFCKGQKYTILMNLVKYFEFDKTKIGTNEVFEEFNRIRDILYNMYHIQHMSSSQICKKYSYPYSSNLHKVFKHLNIPDKSVSYANTENYLYGDVKIHQGKQKYKSGIHVLKNGKTVYLRSSYEFDYANKLDEQNVDYTVESLRIQYYDSQQKKYRCAVPDFYINDINTIVEVKSIFTLDVQNMKDRVQAYTNNGYNFKLILEHQEEDIYHIKIEKGKIVRI